MEPTEEHIRELIGKLASQDYGVRLMALGRLVEASDAAVPQLLAALQHPNALVKACAACALAGIGAPQAVGALIALWEESPRDPSRMEALTEFATKLAQSANPATIPALIELLPCYKKTMGEGSVAGREISRIAAEGLRVLAYKAPTLTLRAALPALKRDMWHVSPDEFGEVRQVIEEATRPWKDLPVTASGPQMRAQELPLPADKPTLS
ncbi:HEAT repeat domain-containing protein [Armatimonas sp.]|uniref:HEAT repeat domain-containing protein n=1 Tax=Armatimonas sp. TaxID=1872638 RepID=UPI00286A7B85|nr:HEAT repeat domain-containing protein [Armatimonas sp.]